VQIIRYTICICEEVNEVPYGCIIVSNWATETGGCESPHCPKAAAHMFLGNFSIQ
jgi:hypothetical protein